MQRCFASAARALHKEHYLAGSEGNAGLDDSQGLAYSTGEALRRTTEAPTPTPLVSGLSKAVVDELEGRHLALVEARPFP